jgi:cytochrome P460
MDFPRRPPSVSTRVARSARSLFDDWQVLACVVAAIGVCISVGAVLFVRPLAAGAMVPDGMPQFTSDGRLLRPEHVDGWVFVGASIGLGYSEAGRSDGPGLFHNVYITAAAYDSYLKTRTFPEGTMLAMTIHDPGEGVAPSRHGFFEGRQRGLEVAVKDSARFRDRWAYFGFVGDLSSVPPMGGSCNACHSRHAATDNVFTQFYPLLRDLP